MSATVLLLHAFPLGPDMWEPQLDPLADAGYVVKTPKLLGRGDSIDGWAEQLLSETSGDLILVGASMGGYCALAIARRAPERLRGLVLAGSKASADPPEGREWRDRAIALVREKGVIALWDEMRGYALSPNASAALVERSIEIVAALDPEEIVQELIAMMSRPDTTDAVPSLPCPLLAIAGERDEGVVAESRQLVEMAPDGELVIVPETAHLVSFERPDAFNPVLLGFLERCLA